MANHTPRYFPDADFPSASALATSSTEPALGVKPPRSTDSEDQPNQRTRHQTQIINNQGISGNARVVNVGGDYITHNDDGLGAEAYTVLESIEQRLRVVHDVILDGKVDGWLSAPDVSQNLNAALRKRQACTGGWFLDGAQFAQWKESSNVVLCIYGAPGCGKTVLCASIIEAVKNFCKARLARLSGWAYFFFDSRNANKGLQMYENFLRSVLSQLCSRCGGTPGAVMAVYQVHGSGKEQPSVMALEETLRKVIGAFDDVYIMVDSLDECGDRGELLKWIETLARWGSTRWHLLTTSRSEPDITSHLERIHNIRIVQLTGKALDKDISVFLDERLSPIIRWSKPIRVLIKTTLVDGADGMFRWVAMHMDSLEHCLNVRAVREKLNTLPRGLEETYEQILAGSPHRHDLLHMLHWLAFSTRALRLEEIAEVASVDFDAADGPCYDPDLKYANSRMALTVCSGLITETDGFVKLAHFSVKEYLISERIKTGTAAHFAMNLHLSHSVVAQTCVAYLLIFSHRESGHYPLHLYAADNLAEHLRLMEGEGCPALRELLLKLFIPTPRYEYALVNWVQMHNFDKNGWAKKEEAPPLFWASFFGLRHVVERLLKNGVDVNEQAINCATALQAAAANGHTEMAKLLLERGANVNIQQEFVGSALQQAVGGRHINIAKLFLAHGANICGPDQGFTTVLQVAEESGNTSIIRLLLEHGADASETRLQVAVAEGRTRTVKFLLQRGANVSIMECGPALQIAASNGHTGIVEMLLEHGVDIERNRGHGTALQVAAANGHTETVKFLLERGANANIQRGGPTGPHHWR